MSAIELLYLKEFTNTSTEKNNGIAKIFNLLFKQNGRIKYEHLKNKKEKIEQFTYTINDPPVVFYNAIKHVISLSNAANLQKPQQ